MAAPVRFLSGRQQQQKIGIEGSTENQKVLEVVGRVGIGTTVFDANKSLDVRGDVDVSGIVSATQFLGDGSQLSNLPASGVGPTDNVNTTGIITASKFSGNGDFTNLAVSGLSTFTGAIDANGGLDVSGGSGLVANTAKISDLTDNRVVIAGNSGELEDSSNLTFDGTKLAVNGNLGVTGLSTTKDLNVSGVSTFVGLVTVTTGDVHIAQRLFVGGLEVEGSGSENTFTGINTFTNLLDNTLGNPDTGSLNVNGGLGVNKNVSFGSTLFVQNAIGIGSAAPIGKLDVNGHTELDDVNVSGAITATTFTGNLAGTVNTAAQTNITSLGTLSALTVSGDITANGNIVGDNSTNITGIAGVTATTLSGTLQTAAQTNVTSVGTLTGLDVNGHSELDGVNVSAALTAASLNVTNKLTTTGLGISVANGTGNTAYIEGPSEIWIDPSPAGAGTTSGLVRIRGDLYVDGTEFIVDVDKVQLGDFRIGIATTAGTNALLDGAGLGIGSESIEKTITWNNATSALMSSENWNLASGKHYEINGTDVLTSTTLGSGVVNSSLTSVGTLGALTVSGNVNANGNIIGDSATNISGINSVTATSFHGSGAGITGLTAGQVGAIADVVSDTTPQLGGNLDVNNKDITGTGNINLTGIITATNFVGGGAGITGLTASQVGAIADIVSDTTPQLGGNLDLNSKLINGTGGINVTGIVTASSFDGNITGVATYTSEWIITSNGSSDYKFTGPGFDGTELDPTIYLIRGQEYKFTNNMGAHPFQIRTAINGSAYNDGVTNNGVSNGTLTWDIQMDAPNVLYYQCTAHAGMVGKIYIGNSGDSINVGTGVTINSGGINVTGIVTATTFSGNATSATTATNVTVADESSDITCNVLFTTGSTGNLGPKSGTNLTFNSANGTLTATEFSGGGVGITGLTASQVGAIADIVSDTTPQLGGNLDVNNKDITGTGNISLTGIVTATDFNSTSDARLKTNIQVISDPLDKIVRINGVSFDWTSDNTSTMGVIADNIQEVLPELVRTSTADYKTVNYNGLIGLLIEVVKEQQTQINSLNERLSQLE